MTLARLCLYMTIISMTMVDPTNASNLGRVISEATKRGMALRDERMSPALFTADESDQEVSGGTESFYRSYRHCGEESPCVTVQFSFKCDTTTCRINPVGFKGRKSDLVQAGLRLHAEKTPEEHEEEARRLLQAIQPAPTASLDSLFDSALEQLDKMGIKWKAKSIPLIGPIIEGFLHTSSKGTGASEDSAAAFLEKHPTSLQQQIPQFAFPLTLGKPSSVSQVVPSTQQGHQPNSNHPNPSQLSPSQLSPSQSHPSQLTQSQLRPSPVDHVAEAAVVRASEDSSSSEENLPKPKVVSGSIILPDLMGEKLLEGMPTQQYTLSFHKPLEESVAPRQFENVETASPAPPAWPPALPGWPPSFPGLEALMNPLEQLLASGQNARQPEQEGEGEEPEIIGYVPVTPLAAFSLDQSSAIRANPFLSNLPTLRPPPLSFKPGEVPFEDWLSRVKLPVNVRTATSGMELLRAVESKTLEYLLSVVRVPMAMSSASLGPVPTLPEFELPEFDAPDSSELRAAVDAASVLAQMQTQALLGRRLAPELQQLGIADSLVGMLTPFLPGGGALGPLSVPMDDSALAELEEPPAEYTSTSDLLPWIPVDSIAGTLPSWLIEAFMGPYALLFQDLVRVAQDGFIRMQLIFDTFADEPIPVTSTGLQKFGEQIAHAFRATPAGDEADAIKSIALTVRELPTFMPSEEKHASGPMLDFYDQWVKQVTRKRRRLRSSNDLLPSPNHLALFWSLPTRPNSYAFESQGAPSIFGSRDDHPTSSDTLPWLPMDSVVGSLPGFYLDKLGKPGKAMKKAAGAWLAGAEKLDLVTKAVLDPLFSNFGAPPPMPDLSERSTNYGNSGSRSSNSGSSDSSYGRSNSGSNNGWGQSSRVENPKSDSTSDGGSSSFVSSMENLMSDLLGGGMSFFNPTRELENANMSGILNGIQTTPGLMNGATLDMMSTFPMLLAAVYDPLNAGGGGGDTMQTFPEISLPDIQDMSLDKLAERLGLPSADALLSQLTGAQFPPLGERVSEAFASPFYLEDPVTDWLNDVKDGLEKVLGGPLNAEDLMPPSLEEVMEASRSLQEAMERYLLQLGLLPLPSDSNPLASVFIGKDGYPPPQLHLPDLDGLTAEEGMQVLALTGLPGLRESILSSAVEKSRKFKDFQQVSSLPDFQQVSSLPDFQQVSSLPDFQQVSSLPEIYASNVALAQRTMESQLNWLSEYNRFLYNTNPFAPIRKEEPTPPPPVVEPPAPPAPAPVVETEGHTPRILPTGSTMDGMSSILGSLIDSVGHTGGEVIGAFANSFVPQIGVPVPSPPGTNKRPRTHAVAQTPAPFTGPLQPAPPSGSIVPGAPRQELPVETLSESPVNFQPLPAPPAPPVVNKIVKDDAALKSREEIARLTAALDRALDALSAARDLIAVNRDFNDLSTSPIFVKPDGVDGDDPLSMNQILFGVLEGINQANYNTVNKIIIPPPLSYALPAGTPDLRLKLSDINRQIAVNEKYGTLGVLMNRDLWSLTQWALARGLINTTRPPGEEKPTIQKPPPVPVPEEEEEEPVETIPMSRPSDEEMMEMMRAVFRDTPLAWSPPKELPVVLSRRLSSDEAEAVPSLRLSKSHIDIAWTPADKDTEMQGIFDSFFNLISSGMADIEKSIREQAVSKPPTVQKEDEPLEDKAKNSAANLMRTVSDNILSSGPNIKDSANTDDADAMQEDYSGAHKCNNSAGCRHNHRQHGNPSSHHQQQQQQQHSEDDSSNRYDTYTGYAGTKGRTSSSPSSSVTRETLDWPSNNNMNKMPQGSVIINPNHVDVDGPAAKPTHRAWPNEEKPSTARKPWYPPPTLWDDQAPQVPPSASPAWQPSRASYGDWNEQQPAAPVWNQQPPPVWNGQPSWTGGDRQPSSSWEDGYYF